MLSLNHSDHRPIYEQIKEQLRQLILTGALSEDEKLPSVRELATHLAINPNTIQRAYRELETDGYIYSVRAKGSFVAPRSKKVISKHCDKLFCVFDKTIEELICAGIEQKELITRIEKHYNKGGNLL